MKISNVTTIFIIIAAFSVALASDHSDPQPKTTVTRNLASIPLAFTQNQGQWPDSILFRPNAGGATMWFTKDGAYYQFTRRVSRTGENNSPEVTLSGVEGRQFVGRDPSGFDNSVIPAQAGIQNRGRQMSTSAPFTDFEPDSLETMMIKVNLVGSNPRATVRGEGLMEYKCNFFPSNDPAKWRTDVPNYSAIVYKDIYPGIDLKYYGPDGKVKYDLIVSPGTAVSQIRIQYQEVKSLSVDADGNLKVETDWGSLVEQNPKVCQWQGAEKATIGADYVLFPDNTFGFRITSSYNPDLPLVIDPILRWATFLRGSDNDYLNDITLDDSGNVYVGGWTNSVDFPFGIPCQDGFVAKLSSSGDSLIYATAINNVWVNGVALDDSGCMYLAGTAGADNVVAAKLTPDGSDLVYLTYIGTGYGQNIAVDNDGDAYLTGQTDSPDFPTVNPFQAELAGYEDAFVCKLGSNGDSLIYSTYVGGWSFDWSYNIEVDGQRHAFIRGITTSDDFPTTPNSFQPTAAGELDIFVTKLDATGGSLAYSTYFGGTGTEAGSGLTLDESGNAYITGQTFSLDLPTWNSIQSFQGFCDGFIAKLNNSGSDLIYSTYLGGSDFDVTLGSAIDSLGNLYVTGLTASQDFPAKNAFQRRRGTHDAVIVKLNSMGNNLIYSTVLGGTSNDECHRVAADDSGNAFIIGQTISLDFPADDPFQTSSGKADGFIAKISPCCQVRGDVDGAEGIQISDPIYLIDYLFRGGPPPFCPEQGDTDNNGRINIADLTFLVDYLFRSGPPPPPCP